METYIGVKVIKAEPQSKMGTAANKETELEFGKEPVELSGYKVEYEDGYTSWSPEDVFEKAYIKINKQPFKPNKEKVYQPHEQRVIEEFEELTDKHLKLEVFIKTIRFKELDETSQLLLNQQFLVMTAYVEILKQRILNF